MHKIICRANSKHKCKDEGQYFKVKFHTLSDLQTEDLLVCETPVNTILCLSINFVVVLYHVYFKVMLQALWS